MMALMFIGNVVLSTSSLFMPFRRYGPDFTAYVNQAGQFASGQNTYAKLSSIQGQCFYPAGHLYTYVPVYWLWLKTEHAEHIWKVCHYLFHSLIQLLIAKISYSYFKLNPLKAQLICFMLLGNEEIREFNAYLFNDTFLALYAIISVYLMSKNRPILAALFLSMSCSIKAGAMLLLPCFLGWIQYIYGTKRLVICVIVVVCL